MVLSVSGAELPGDVLLATGIDDREAKVRQLTNSARALGQAAARPSNIGYRLRATNSLPCLVYRGPGKRRCGSGWVECRCSARRT